VNDTAAEEEGKEEGRGTEVGRGVEKNGEIGGQ